MGETLEVSRSTIARVRRRLREVGAVAALTARPRHTRPATKLDGRAAAPLMARTWSPPPAGSDRWPVRLLTDRCVAVGVRDPVS